MLKRIRKVLNGIRIGVKIFIKTSVIALLILNMIMIVTVSQFLNTLDAKTDVMIDVIREYRKPTLPNFENLVKANVVIINKTQGCSGSGTTIKIDDKIYILSAGHLDDPTDTFFVKQDKEYRSIILVKVNHAVDLALFEYVENYNDLVTANISNDEPKVGDRIWTIGNPAMLEDAITSGTLVRKINFSYLIDAKIYFGSSGGGLFNTKGELIGVNVAMGGIGTYILGMSVNLSTINAFLSGKIYNELEDKG